jgi:hypothetical protein
VLQSLREFYGTPSTPALAGIQLRLFTLGKQVLRSAEPLSSERRPPDSLQLISAESLIVAVEMLLSDWGQ